MVSKWIILLILSLLIGSVQAMNYDQVTIQLTGDENGTANFSINFSLSDMEQTLAKFANQETLDEARTLFGLRDKRSGMFTFSTRGATRREERNGSQVLLFDGYNFTRMNWKPDIPPIKNEVMDKLYNSSIRPFIDPDFEPDKVTVIWPDGTEETFENVSFVPNLTWAIPSNK